METIQRQSWGDFAALVREQREFFASGATRSPEFREAQLGVLATVIESAESRILAALRADLGRPERDGLLAEVLLSRAEAEFARKNVRRWMRPARRRVPPLLWPSRAVVRREPFGVACVMGPWNYPFYLVLAPLAGAIAGGNCAIIKASEFAPRCADVLAEMVAAAFPPEYITVVRGERAASEALLEEHFDCLFFTGGTEAGRAVMQAAARHLTPVTLELGGKSPCIVCADSDIDVAARRIVWGKFLNAGQTCVAPDHVLVEREAHGRLVEAMRCEVAELYPDGCGRIVSARHFERLVAFLKCGTPVCGGGHDAAKLSIEPTLLTDVAADSLVMREEIFGPILPVLPFGSIDEAIASVRSRGHPLALYLFTRNDATQRRVVTETQSGGMCVNDVVVHLMGCQLPFGGVGPSGMGAYHGHDSFLAFTQQRTVIRRSTWPDPPMRYPGFRMSLDWARRLYRFLLRE